MDIAAAEEEISRWKAAAKQEAEAGYVAQVGSHRDWRLPFIC